MDRRVARNNTPTVKKEKEKVDYVALGVKKLTEELDLDAFQQAVVYDLMESTQNEEKKIYALDVPDDAKIQKIITLRDKLNTDLTAVLNPVQVEKFQKLREKQEKKNKKK